MALKIAQIIGQGEVHGRDLEIFCEQTSGRIWGAPLPVCIVELHGCDIWLATRNVYV